MAEKIDAPVGLRWRTGNVANIAVDQKTIVALLAAIPAAQGGKKETWTTPPLAGPNGTCPKPLADAIWDFQSFWKSKGVFHVIDGVVDPGGHTLAKLNELAPASAPPGPAPGPVGGPEKILIVHDVRLFGWRPVGDVVEVNGDTPLSWVIDSTIARGRDNGGNVILKIMAHGLPGFVQCARGAFAHPTLGDVWDDSYHPPKFIGPGPGGMCEDDLPAFARLEGFVKRIEFHSCLVARIGPCFEANGHACYDGNAFCYKLAQVTGAEVKASAHVQYYWGRDPRLGMHFGSWNGLVFTWGPVGNIVATESFPYQDFGGPPPPGTPPT